MKGYLHYYALLVLLFCSSSFVFSQQITVDDSVPLQDLILNNLVEGCVEISNIRSSVNGSSSGLSSYAYFNQGSSNFPLSDGIMLSTGNAESGGITLNSQTLSDGTNTWGTDPDIETALGVTNTLNATSIEFDLVSISDQIQFNYLFASEEYFGTNPCQFSDGFVILISEGNSGIYQNIALVPVTGDVVNTNTIHDEIYGNNGSICSAQNDQYFDGYNMGDTNYNGRTVPLTATYPITPYTQYHIKLIIADQNDSQYDSAVFLEAITFNEIDLGDDIVTCLTSAQLDATFQNPQATYAWFLDNVQIPGETSPTLPAIQDGVYSVEVTVPLNNTFCVLEDNVQVTLNSEPPVNPIPDFELCDATSGDGVEVFDLQIHEPIIRGILPSGNYDLSFYHTEQDARDDIGEITMPISNTANPDTVYVKIQNLVTGCYSYAPFNLVVNSLPNIIASSTLPVCDSDGVPNGVTAIDLSQKDNEMTSGQPNLTVTYHLSQTDADSGNGPLSIPYVNSTSPYMQTLYVRVVNSQTSCFSTTTLDIEVTDSPSINTDTRYLDACDPDHDGIYENFNLNDAISDILGMSGITPTFHTTLADAESGSNPIPDPSNFQNTEQDMQTLYIRAEDNNTGCATIIPLEVHSNLLLTGVNLDDFALCDDDNNDLIADFYLNSIAAYIINDLPYNLSITFYEDMVDRDTNNTANALDTSQLYTAASPKILYLNIANNDTGCSEQAEITLLVNPVIKFQSVNPIEYCDTDDDGTVNVDFHSLDDLIKSGNPDFEVHYFQTPEEAEDNINEFSFLEVTGTQTFYARIVNIESSCHTVNEFEITINPAPAVSNPSPISICDDDQDGFSVINLEDNIQEIVTDPTGLDFSFYTSLNDAQIKANAIPSPSTYNANTQNVYVRVENSGECPNYATISITVSTLPVFPSISNYEICESDGDEKEEFLLSEKDTEILNGQTGKEVLYFEDANYTNLIPKNTSYTNTSSPQIVYVRVQNTANTNCFADTSFTIEVSNNPVYNIDFSDFGVCDDSSNDGKDVFDLNEKIDEISQGAIADLNISFHISQQDADNNEGPLPMQYTNASNPQTLYVRIQEVNSSCYLVEELGINITAAPYVTQASPMRVCDTDHDGFTIFNLEDSDFQLNERVPSNFIINYFENEADIEDVSKQINNPTIYTNKTNPQTVYIKVTNTLTGCYSIIPQELIVDLPPITFSIDTVEICYNETNTYDLSQLDTYVTNAQSNSDISYHTSPSDAENNTNPVPDNIFEYTGTSGLYTFYARIVSRDTQCPIIAPPFNLQINPNPVANTPPNLEGCDDDDDGFLVFDLSQQDNFILGNQDPNNFTVTYHQSFEDAENRANPLNNLHSAYNNEVVYARVKDNTTECYSTTSFSIIVYPLPAININDTVPLCNDTPVIISADTGNSGDSYLWSTNETTTEIMVYPDQLGDYWVTVRTPNNCETTKAFSVIKSEEATINFTTTVDFADPNSITVDVSGVGDYVYILDNGEPQTSNVFEDVRLGLHTVTVRDLNGCDDVTKEVIVIDAPKFVTPNNDGTFDTWQIVGIEEIPETTVYIYDRHGKLLKTLLSNSVGWDGTYKGQNMPSDDYWFVAKVKKDGSEFDVKGHFALKR